MEYAPITAYSGYDVNFSAGLHATKALRTVTPLSFYPLLKTFTGPPPAVLRLCARVTFSTERYLRGYFITSNCRLGRRTNA